MTAQEHEVLKARIKKGREYLKKEYWVAYGGKGRKDPEILRLVKLWEDMVFEAVQYENQERKNS